MGAFLKKGAGLPGCRFKTRTQPSIRNDKLFYITASRGFTQKHRLAPIGFRWTQDLSVKQVPTEDDCQTSFVQRLHDDRPDSFVVGKQVECGEEEEENERQPEEDEERRQHKSILQLICRQKTHTDLKRNK